MNTNKRETCHSEQFLLNKMKCLYQFGNYKIYNKFSTPTFELFENWRNEFLSKNNLKDYNILYWGNSAENMFGQSQIPTTDIDIIIHNPIINYKEVSEILQSAFEIGLSHNLLIDIYFTDIDIFSKFNFDENMAISKTHYIIRFYKEIILNESKVVVVSDSTEFDILPNGLWGLLRTDVNIPHTKSFKKYIDRITTGQYLGLKFDLKTMKLISYN